MVMDWPPTTAKPAEVREHADANTRTTAHNPIAAAFTVASLTPALGRALRKNDCFTAAAEEV